MTEPRFHSFRRLQRLVALLVGSIALAAGCSGADADAPWLGTWACVADHGGMSPGTLTIGDGSFSASIGKDHPGWADDKESYSGTWRRSGSKVVVDWVTPRFLASQAETFDVSSFSADTGSDISVSGEYHDNVLKVLGMDEFQMFEFDNDEYRPIMTCQRGEDADFKELEKKAQSAADKLNR